MKLQDGSPGSTISRGLAGGPLWLSCVLLERRNNPPSRPESHDHFVANVGGISATVSTSSPLAEGTSVEGVLRALSGKPLPFELSKTAPRKTSAIQTGQISTKARGTRFLITNNPLESEREAGPRILLTPRQIHRLLNRAQLRQKASRITVLLRLASTVGHKSGPISGDRCAPDASMIGRPLRKPKEGPLWLPEGFLCTNAHRRKEGIC